MIVDNKCDMCGKPFEPGPVLYISGIGFVHLSCGDRWRAEYTKPDPDRARRSMEALKETAARLRKRPRAPR